MADGLNPAPESWRIVVFTNIPGGVIYSLVDEVVRPLGHRVVGVVTSPGPKRRRSPAYLEVVAAVSPGVDVIVSNHPERWAAMLAPLRPDLIISGGFPWRIPGRGPGPASARGDQLAPRPPAPVPRPGRHRVGSSQRGRRDWASPSTDSRPTSTPARSWPRRASRSPTTTTSTRSMAKFGPVLPGLLGQALERVARGDPGEPQDEAEATYAGLFEEEWRIIDWSQPARTVHNQVRSWIGLRDIPAGALGEIDGETLQITKTRLIPDGAHEAGASATRHGRASGWRTPGRAMW